jgi:hypothetical protein
MNSANPVQFHVRQAANRAAADVARWLRGLPHIGAALAQLHAEDVFSFHAELLGLIEAPILDIPGIREAMIPEDVPAKPTEHVLIAEVATGPKPASPRKAPKRDRPPADPEEPAPKESEGE